MRTFTTVLLLTLLCSEMRAESQQQTNLIEVRSYLISGPGGAYGFYEVTSPLYGRWSMMLIADRQFRVPFRITRALLPCGIATIFIVGGAVWYRRRRLP